MAKDRKTKVVFFAGTDTDIGKTYVASQVAAHCRTLGMKVAVYKPVASGCQIESGQRVSEDAVALWNAAGFPETLATVCPQLFLAPLAPPESAAAEGRSVDKELMTVGLRPWTTPPYDVCFVEGAGGLMSPIAEGMLNLDFARQIQPDLILLVSANRLGCIHQTLSTVAAATLHRLTIDGIVMNRPTDQDAPSADTNARSIEQYCDTPVLGDFAFGATSLPQALDRWLKTHLG